MNLQSYTILTYWALSLLKAPLKSRATANPLPRIAECTAGLINSVGLQNPGVYAVAEKELPRLKKCFHKKVIANISGFTVEDYVECCKVMNEQEQVGLLEVQYQLSQCAWGGMAFGTSARTAAQITKAVKAVADKPVYIKLSPNVTDIVQIAKACKSAGADGLSLINTLMGMRIDLKSRKPAVANTMGGFSGPAVFPVALRMVYQVYEAVQIPVIGIGGVQSAADVIEMMLAGASAVQVGAANLVNPYACRDIVNTLPEVMEKYKIQCLSEIIGGAHHG